jgi:hypothetical protein
MFFIFRVGHAPMFIPWSDISVEYHRGWLRSYADFHFEKLQQVPLRISRSLGEKVLAAGGNMIQPTEAA